MRKWRRLSRLAWDGSGGHCTEVVRKPDLSGNKQRLSGQWVTASYCHGLKQADDCLLPHLSQQQHSLVIPPVKSETAASLNLAMLRKRHSIAITSKLMVSSPLLSGDCTSSLWPCLSVWRENLLDFRAARLGASCRQTYDGFWRELMRGRNSNSSSCGCSSIYAYECQILCRLCRFVSHISLYVRNLCRPVNSEGAFLTTVPLVTSVQCWLDVVQWCWSRQIEKNNYTDELRSRQVP